MTSRFLARATGLFLLLAAAVASAAPTQVEVVYEATRNGQPFATVTETYRVEDGRYRIESVTRGSGIYALFGERRLTSEGEVTPQGLKPGHFELHQGDNERKALYADFDWAAGKLTMKVKGKPETVALPAGTQDLSSFMYQFMFSQPEGSELVLPVTTGKRLKRYRYTVLERGASLQTAAGDFTTIHLADTDKSDDEGKQIWLGKEAHYLPVRLVMKDDGATIAQTLTSLRVK
jgi:hypothetical protein